MMWAANARAGAERLGECDDGALQGSEPVLGTAASMPREPCQVGFAYNFRGNIKMAGS